jgi:co-chaperonin GroES (HSP10)
MITVKGCRLLIKPFKIQEHDKVFAAAKAAGIALPEFSERKEQANVDKGSVIQIGPNCHEDYVGDLKIGDVVGFAKFGGKFLTDPETEELYLVINDEDVICVFGENK